MVVWDEDGALGRCAVAPERGCCALDMAGWGIQGENGCPRLKERRFHRISKEVLWYFAEGM